MDAAPDAGTAQDTSAAPMTWTVMVAPNGIHTFSPSSLSIRVGDTVHWVWQGSGHTVTSGTGGVPDGAFCSPSDTTCSSPVPSDAGATYDHVFTTAGTFAYFCTQHPQVMTGSIAVQ
jgi:plastocyanin